MSQTDDGILPDFIVIGAMKAATTSLYTMLARHPRIGMSHEKESDFFIENNYERKWATYYAQFRPGFDLYGEASPNYTKRLVFPMAAPRIRTHLPQIKLIYVVRDPVDRLVSHYKHIQLSGEDVPPPDRLVGTEVWDRLLDASLYHRQVEAYREFFDDGRLLIVDFDALSAAPVATMNTVGAYLGVPDGWDGLGLDRLGSANSGSERARMPRWALRLNETGAVSTVKRLLPKSAARHVRRLLGRGPVRETLAPDAATLAAAREACAPDAAAFRALTGLRFDSWSV